MATGRIGAATNADAIGDIATAIEAELNISGSIQVGGVGGVTSEPCHGFVHIVATGTADTDIDAAVAAVAGADFIPGEVAVA